MNILKNSVLGALFFLFLMSANAQEITPQQTLSTFKNASRAKLDKLSKRYELKDDWRGYVCHDLSPSMLHSSSISVSLILIKSSDCQLSFLLPFWKVGTSWTYSGTIELSNSEGVEPTVSLKPLVVGQPAAIVVDDNLVASGTGLNQQNLQIFMLVEGKNKLVLNEPHKQFLRTQLQGGGAYTQERESSFKFSANPEAAGNVVITELRKSTVNDLSITEHYVYSWSPRLKTLTLLASSPE